MDFCIYFEILKYRVTSLHILITNFFFFLDPLKFHTGGNASPSLPSSWPCVSSSSTILQTVIIEVLQKSKVGVEELQGTKLEELAG